MPDRTILQRVVSAAGHRWPVSQRLLLAPLDWFYRVALWPYRRHARTASSAEQPEIVSGTREFNAAAERYYAEFKTPEFLLDKPFSETSLAAKHLIDAGVLIDALRLQPGDRVVEIGAGSAWLSQILNRFGCHTVAVDVSPTAAVFARQLFERDSRTRWSLEPEFLTYDGRRLPLPDGSCDRVVITDAFHHIPNQRELLTEMHRVLTSDGFVGMSEPGRGHGSAEHSVLESAATGVLENELVLENVNVLARECGFSRVTVVPASPAMASWEIDAGKLGAFMGGRGFAAYWKAFCGSLDRHHYILCHKSDVAATTRRPRVLRAAIQLRERAIQIAEGESGRVTVRVANRGDTRWLSKSESSGWTRVGVHLYRDDARRALVDWDWHRAELPVDVAPGQAIDLVFTLPPLKQSGRHVAVVDLVVEGLTWFAERGSTTEEFVIEQAGRTA